jgi:enamine deaminase RidA (YjgF/YER057c/UK114 family)
MPKEHINPDSLFQLPEVFSQAVKVGNVIYIAGQTGQGADGSVPSDFAAQVVKTYENMKTVLASVGAKFEDLVKETIYLTRSEDIPALMEVRAKYVTKPAQASTWTVISALAVPELLIEIEGIAVME